MSKFASLALVAVLVALVPSVASDPKPDAKDKEKAAQEKAVKEVVEKAVTAIAKRDIEALLEMSDTPFLRPGANTSDDKAQMKRDLRSAFEGHPAFDPKYKILSFETFKEAKSGSAKDSAEAIGKLLTDTDHVIYVEVTYREKPVEICILVKMRDGKPRFVGFLI